MATRVSQDVVEAAVTATPNVRASQDVVEAAVTATPKVRASQDVVEAAVVATPNARCTLLIVEVAIPNVIIPSPPRYPEMLGLTYNVKWAPGFFTYATATNDSGSDVDVAASPYPLHTFTLSYNFLRNFWEQQEYWKNEFRKMTGFFEQVFANNGRFIFKNPDDYIAVSQFVATTDGINSVFGPIPRSYGAAPFVATEPVGWVDQNNVFNVYLGKQKMSPTKYTILHTNLWNQRIKFYDTPPSGLAVTIDMQYDYYCKFEASVNTFEKFLEKVWLLNEVKIFSCREGV